METPLRRVWSWTKVFRRTQNIIADALSRLNIKISETESTNLQSLLILNAECFADDKLSEEQFPLSIKVIQKHQQLGKE